MPASRCPPDIASEEWSSVPASSGPVRVCHLPQAGATAHPASSTCMAAAGCRAARRPMTPSPSGSPPAGRLDGDQRRLRAGARAPFPAAVQECEAVVRWAFARMPASSTSDADDQRRRRQRRRQSRGGDDARFSRHASRHSQASSCSIRRSIPSRAGPPSPRTPTARSSRRRGCAPTAAAILPEPGRSEQSIGRAAPSTRSRRPAAGFHRGGRARSTARRRHRLCRASRPSGVPVQLDRGTSLIPRLSAGMSFSAKARGGLAAACAGCASWRRIADRNSKWPAAAASVPNLKFATLTGSAASRTSNSKSTLESTSSSVA